MDVNIIYALTGTLAVLLAGIIVLVPILALTLRHALRPLVETWIQARHAQWEGRGLQLDRRVAELEETVDQLRITCESLQEAQDFQRQLAEPTIARIPRNDG
jgi:hypothetical protein